MSEARDLATIEEAFEMLPDWQERYRFIIELGRELKPLADAEKVEANKVEGCMSQVWLVADPQEGGRLALRADSDAHIVKGLIAILMAMFSGRTASEISGVDTEAVFGRLGLANHLSMGRRNGLEAMVRRIRLLAAGGSRPEEGG